MERNDLQKYLTQVQSVGNLGFWEVSLVDHQSRWSVQLFEMLRRPLHMGSPTPSEYLQQIHQDDRQKYLDFRNRAISTGERFSMRLRICASYLLKELILESGGARDSFQ